MRLLSVVVALFVGCGSPAPVEPAPIRPVRFVVAEEAGGALRGTFSGTTEAGDQATLSFSTPGTVHDVLVSVGDRVRVGEPLAMLRDTQLQLQLQEARASSAQARASRTLAEQSLDRSEALYLSSSASVASVETARANLDGARAASAASARQVELAQDQLTQGTLKANRDGQVASVLVTEGEFVGGGAPVVVLTPDQALQVTVVVPSRWIGRLSTGDSAQVELAELDSLTVEARVVEVGVTGQGASFPMTIELSEQDERVRPGMVATVTLDVGEVQEQRMELPVSAIAQDQIGDFVWGLRTEDDGLASAYRVDVITGELTDADSIVVTGVESGTLVATAGLSVLYDGFVVRLTTP